MLAFPSSTGSPPPARSAGCSECKDHVRYARIVSGYSAGSLQHRCGGLRGEDGCQQPTARSRHSLGGQAVPQCCSVRQALAVNRGQATSGSTALLRSDHNSLVGMLNRDAPQSKQTEIVGSTRTPGLPSRLGAEKWIIISVVNSDWLSEEHCAHDIGGTLQCSHCTQGRYPRSINTCA
jgi:hypothetical protein